MDTLPKSNKLSVCQRIGTVLTSDKQIYQTSIVPVKHGWHDDRFCSYANSRALMGREKRPDHSRLLWTENDFGLAKHLFELVDEALRERMIHIFARGFRELLEQLALARCQPLRSLDDDLH